MADYEKALATISLICVFGLFFWYGPGLSMEHSIVHEFPFNYRASDAFVHLSYLQGLNESGAWKYYKPGISLGYGDVLAFNPPLLYLAADQFSIISGLPLHDSIYYLIYFFCAVAVFLAFGFAYIYSELGAVLLLPFALIFTVDRWTTLFTWGTWPYVLGSVFLIACFIVVRRPYLLALMLAGAALSHTSEYIFACAFVIAYMVYTGRIFKWVVPIAISFFLSLYYLTIFKYTWMVVTPYNFKVQLASTYKGIWIPSLASFNLLGYVLIPAIIILLIILLSNLLTRHKINQLQFAILFILIVSFTNLVGFGLRAFQTRLFWPIYLGLIPCVVWQYIPKFKFKSIAAFSLGSLICLALVGTTTYEESPSLYGIISPEKWALFNYINSLSEDSRVLFFFNIRFDQNAQFFILNKRAYYVLPSSIDEQFNQRKLSPIHKIYHLGEGKSNYAYFNNFQFKYHLTEYGSPIKNESVCEYDYLVFDDTLSSRYSRYKEYGDLIQGALGDYNILPIFQSYDFKVYELKEGDCFDERPLS